MTLKINSMWRNESFVDKNRFRCKSKVNETRSNKGFEGDQKIDWNGTNESKVVATFKRNWERENYKNITSRIKTATHLSCYGSLIWKEI